MLYVSHIGEGRRVLAKNREGKNQLVGLSVQDRRMDGWMEGWMEGWMDGWMDGWTDGRMD
jgi:hypothetical protein